MTCDVHFRTWISYSNQKSCVKIWFGLVEPFKSYHLNFPWEQKPPIRGVASDLQCPFSDLAELFQAKVICVNLVLDWLSPSRVIVSTNIFLWGRLPLLGGVTFELWCPFLNSDELFQSKFMCGNLVWIGWNRRHVNFEGGGRPTVRGGYMWPAMPIFELDRGCLDESHAWKFGSDWLRLSRVIVRKNQMTRGRGRIRVRGRRTKIFKVRYRSSPYRWA